MSDFPGVLVVGGGVAGLAAASLLAGGGAQVCLVERRGEPGGRAFSYREPKTGIEIDNGQHLFLGCCTSLIGWLDKIGSLGLANIQPRAAIPLLSADGRLGWIRESPLPAPLHALPSLLTFGHLRFSERLSVAAALKRLAAASEADRAGWESLSVAALLARWGQSRRSLAAFWEPVVVSAANAGLDRVSAAVAARLFREGFMTGRSGCRIGLARAGLSDLVARPAARLIEGKGGRVVTGRRVERFLVEGGRVSGARLWDGEILRADSYVSALPWDDLLAALPPGIAADPHFSRARNLVPSPILGIHLWLDRPVLDLEFVGLLESPLHWVFNQSRIRKSGPLSLEGEGQYLSLIISDAGRWTESSQKEIVAMVLSELRRFFPAARAADLVHAVVLKEKKATFAPVPGSAAWRLPARTPIPNLFLAGAWTDTGWPATLEGAVRSAEASVEAVIEGRLGGRRQETRK